MTEIFPINDANALTGNGRRACSTQSVTVVTHSVTQRDKHEAFSEILIADSQT